jgi:hypothetical protein
MNAIYTLYADPTSAEHAVEALHTVGVADRDIVVMSSEPIDERRTSRRQESTGLFWIAAAGGGAGGSVGLWLTIATARAWPLVTGGMPIVAWWPTLIVVFELTMLGAMLATTTALIVTAKLLRRGSALNSPEIADGKILVGVENPPDDMVGAVERALGTGCRRVTS